MDWNSFFSTMSQSAAGLIAIIAAFVISKLLGENEKQDKLDGDVEDLIIEYNNIIERISIRNFEWYDRANINNGSNLETAIKSGEFNNLSDEEKLEKLFIIIPSLYRTDQCLNLLNERITELTSRVYPVINLASTARLWDSIEEERELINNVLIDSKTLLNKFQKIKSDIIATHKNLSPFQTTIYILGVAFFLTVIYPLHFMPMELNKIPEISFSFESIIRLIFSLKGFFLSILSFVVIMIFGYFILVLKRTEKNYKVLQGKLHNRYFNLSDYCRYFTN